MTTRNPNKKGYAPVDICWICWEAIKVGEKRKMADGRVAHEQCALAAGYLAQGKDGKGTPT